MQFFTTHLTEIIAGITAALTSVGTYFLGKQQRKVEAVHSMRELYNQFVEDYKDRYNELQNDMDNIRANQRTNEDQIKELKIQNQSLKTEIQKLHKENQSLKADLKKYMS